jgi:hypothetical protein
MCGSLSVISLYGTFCTAASHFIWRRKKKTTCGGTGRCLFFLLLIEFYYSLFGKGKDNRLIVGSAAFLLFKILIF